MGQGRGNSDQKNPKEVLSIFLLKDNKHKWAINSGKDGGGKEGGGGWRGFQSAFSRFIHS